MSKISSDEVMLREIRKGNKAYIDVLLEKYKPMVRGKANTMNFLGGDKDDLVQEGMIGLFQAIRDYDEEKESSFATFASLCISRQIYTAVQKDKRKKNIPLNSYISLYSESEKDGSMLVEELRLDKDGGNPESLMIAKEKQNLIKEIMENSLSKLERETLTLQISGMDISTIAQFLEKSSKQVENALHRAKDKLKKELQKSP